MSSCFSALAGKDDSRAVELINLEQNIATLNNYSLVDKIEYLIEGNWLKQLQEKLILE